jgi:C1A family cysteine protease
VGAQEEWPYDIARFAVQPPDSCYRSGLSSRALVYQRVAQDASHVKAVLAEGFDIVFGFSCLPQLESVEMARTGVLAMPGPSNQQVLGGHCVRAIGYTGAALPDIPAEHFIIANSWGLEGALKGYFAMPYAYLLIQTLPPASGPSRRWRNREHSR